MAVKFSQFLAEALSSPSFLVGYNSTTNLNVRVSYADLVAAFTPGTGTVNYVAKWTGTSVLGNSQIFDNGTSVGVNTATPNAGFTLDNNGAFRNFGQAAFLMNTADAGGGNGAVGLGILPASVSRISGERVLMIQSYYSTIRLTDNQNYTFEITLGTPRVPVIGTTNSQPFDFQTNATRQARFFSNGNLLLQSGGTFTDAGYRLDVTGTFRSTLDANINGLTVGKGLASVATNTAFGVTALNAITTGGNNTAIGNEAGKAITTGIHGTFVGSKAGILATGRHNTFVGSQSGLAVVGGEQNTLIGAFAGYQITSGQYNTLIGYAAGIGLTTGNYNTIIGSDVTVSSSLSNTIILADGQGNQRIVVNSSNQIGLGGQPVAPYPVHITAVGGYGLAVRNGTTTTKLTQVNDGSITLGDGSGNYASIENVGTSGLFRFTSALYQFRIGSTNSIYIPASANVLIGTTTDAGYKLDVNGTARVSGITQIQNIKYDLSAGIQYIDYTSRVIITSSNNSIFEIYSNGQGLTVDNSRVVSYKRFDFAQFSSNPAAGNAGVYYNTTDNALRIYNGTNWQNILAPNSSGNVGIGTATPNASALLDVSSTTKGFLPPRMTNAQMVAIATPAAGLVVYDTTNNKLSVYDGATWIAVH